MDSKTLAPRREPLRLIVYLSSVVQLLSESELEEILELARCRNAEANITGLLLYAEGNVIQAIEGPPDGLRQLYSKILADTRHRGVITLLDKPTDKRIFSNWSMGLAKTTRDRLDFIDGLTNFLETGESGDQIDSRQVMLLLKQFRKSSRLAA